MKINLRPFFRIAIAISFAFFGFSNSITAQNTSNIEQRLSIRADGAAPNASSILDIQSTTGGMLIPRMTTAQRNAIANPAAGLLVYDTDENAFYFFDGTWNRLSRNTLDGAYDEGPNLGDGRMIFADSGAVEIQSDSMALRLLDVDSTSFAFRNLAHIEIKRPGNGLRVWHDHNGNAIEAVNSHSGTALKAINSGLGHVAKFETTTNLNTEPAVVIINEGASNALEVDQEDEVGSAANFSTNQADNIAATVKVLNQAKGAGIQIEQGGDAGDGIVVAHNAKAGSAGNFNTIDIDNTDPSMSINNQGKGIGLVVEQQNDTGSAGSFDTNSGDNTDPTLQINNLGKGAGIKISQDGDAGNGVEVVHDAPDGNAGNFKNTDAANNKAVIDAHHQGLGEGAIMKSDSSFGVIGISTSTDLNKAGVRAVGNSDKEKAAALNIHDGAITVSGPKRPAGRDTLLLSWIPIGDGDDNDLIGHFSFATINNALIDEDRSVIILTPQQVFDVPLMIDIVNIVDGSVNIKVGSLGPIEPLQTVIVHYLIINDNGPN